MKNLILLLLISFNIYITHAQQFNPDKKIRINPDWVMNSKKYLRNIVGPLRYNTYFYYESKCGYDSTGNWLEIANDSVSANILYLETRFLMNVKTFRIHSYIKLRYNIRNDSVYIKNIKDIPGFLLTKSKPDLINIDSLKQMLSSKKINSGKVCFIKCKYIDQYQCFVYLISTNRRRLKHADIMNHYYLNAKNGEIIKIIRNSKVCLDEIESDITFIGDSYCRCRKIKKNLF